MFTELQIAAKSILQSIEKLNKNTKLIAVSKTKPAELLKEAYDIGLRHFGENYVDELVQKHSQLPSDINWHFIGHLQSNKCNQLLSVPNLYMVETVDTKKLAEKLQKGVLKLNRNPLNVLVQVKMSQEETKHGTGEQESFEIIEYIVKECPNLKFCGLMTIGEEGDLEVFKRMKQLRDVVSQRYNIKADDMELSMGMSNDYEAAIQEGSTQVRVGSKIFGARNYIK